MVDLLQRHGGWAQTEVLSCFDPLEISTRSWLPTIVQPCGQLDDRLDSNEHVVGIAGNLLYNSNWHEPRELSPEALDACCLGAATFHHTSYAVRLHPGKALGKRTRAALEEQAAKRARLDEAGA